MCRKKLCPHCKTGKYTYELDRHSPVCPYFYCHNGKKCAMYERLNEPQKRGILRRILDRVTATPPRKIELVTAFLSCLYVVWNGSN